MVLLLNHFLNTHVCVGRLVLLSAVSLLQKCFFLQWAMVNADTQLLRVLRISISDGGVLGASSPRLRELYGREDRENARDRRC